MKTTLSITIEEEDAEELRTICAHIGIPVSQLFQEAAKGYIKAAKLSKLLEKKPGSRWALLGLFAKGVGIEAH